MVFKSYEVACWLEGQARILSVRSNILLSKGQILQNTDQGLLEASHHTPEAKVKPSLCRTKSGNDLILYINRGFFSEWT